MALLFSFREYWKPQTHFNIALTADLIRIGLNLATGWVCKTGFKLVKIDVVFISAYLQSCLDSYVQKKITLLACCSAMKFILLLM